MKARLRPIAVLAATISIFAALQLAPTAHANESDTASGVSKLPSRDCQVGGPAGWTPSSGQPAAAEHAEAAAELSAAAAEHAEAAAELSAAAAELAIIEDYLGGSFCAPLSKPYSQQCETMESFLDGCNVSVTQTQSYTSFLQNSGVSSEVDDVGARVQLQQRIPSLVTNKLPGGYWPPTNSVPSTEKVLYVVGPLLAAMNEDDDYDSIGAELLDVSNSAPALSNIMNRNPEVGVVYIGFGDAPDSHLPVAARVDAVKQAIRSFEAVRAAQGPREESMLVGVSLGGVVGKIALHELESEQFDHGVDTFVSFDSPHHGAYIPHSLQYIPLFLKGALAWVDDENFGLLPNTAERQADKAINLTLRSPIAQDLLISNLGYPDSKSPNIDYIRSRYYDLPTTTRNIAVASGSIDGSRPDSATGILSASTGKASSRRAKAMVSFRTTLPSIDEKSVTFSGQMSFKSSVSSSFQIGKRVRYTRTFTVHPSWAQAFDRGPCARSDRSVEDMSLQMDAALSTVWSNRTVTNEGGAACLIPTYSATIGQLVNNQQVVGSSAFDQVIGDSQNKNHLATSQAMDAQILAVVDETFGAPVRPTYEVDDWLAEHFTD